MAKAAKLLAACLVILALSHTVHAADTVSRLVFQSPSPDDRAILGTVLGSDFVEGLGAFPPEMLVSKVDLNGDGREDMVAVQKGFCSNHACTFRLLLNEPSGNWEEAGALDSWAIPYLAADRAGSMGEVIVFDHRTDDCLACSPPTPVRMTWHSEAGRYVEAGPVKTDRQTHFEPSWDWSGRP
ncbi:hypothetical protein [uncultured Pseudodesulfovibrio sp.]|uniref:hypothetical protein n=1 Tax=uncultured Pseudodesulfovibrio sp. TaxID=2035858 RepID=UPI0029C67E45|nr:hypothetical protein [uncultured Pseudodesulfovibrio sp.]